MKAEEMAEIEPDCRRNIAITLKIRRLGKHFCVR